MFQGQMCSNNKLEEMQHQKIIKDNVQPVDSNKRVTLQIYYRNRIN